MQINKKLNLGFRIQGIFILFLFLILLSSCNDDSLVGSALLDQDGVNVEFTDTVGIKALNIKGVDSIQTNSSTNFSEDLFLGEMHDEYFGFKKYDAYFEVSLGSSSPAFYDYENESFATVDSVILLINLNESLFYGDTLEEHRIQAFQFESEVEDGTELYTSDEIPVNAVPISEEQVIVPNLSNYELVFQGDSATTKPSIRIKLDNEFGEMIVNDTSAVKQDSAFQALLKGIKLVSTVEETSVIPLDLAVKSLTDIGNKLFVYYQDTLPKVYSFILGGVRHNQVTSDIAGTDFQTSLNNEAFSDSLVFLQGFGCGDAVIEFPGANFDNFGNVLIKKAELEITVREFAGDLINRNPINLLFLFTEDDDGNRRPIDEILISDGSNLLTEGFGGNVIEETNDNGGIIRRYYTMNITGYFQDLIRENSSAGELILGAAVPSLSPERTILYGPGNSDYPMKLKLTYSIPN